MAKTIFITRDLTDNSPLRKLSNYQITGFSLIDFHLIKLKNLPKSNWIFFYSQQGVRHFMMQGVLPEKDVKFAAFGLKTAQTCTDAGLSLSFVGNGNAERTANALLLVARESNILFVRAMRSLRSVQKFIKNELETNEIIVYDNLSKERFHVDFADILIFTSPLNAKTYFSKYSLDRGQVIIAIGQTTAAAIREFGVQKVKVPLNPSEEAIVSLIENL